MATRRSGELARLQDHFRRVLAELGARDLRDLTPAQRTTRSYLLAELRRYARRGLFPQNLDHPSVMMPYFIDAAGTRCAMAHLIEATGARDLVARVAATANNAFIREIEADLELRAWLDRAGLTAAEAARIQPSYCFLTKADVCLCQQYPGEAQAVVEATVTAKVDESSVKAKVELVHGDSKAATVGQEVETYGQVAVGTPVLISVEVNGDTMPNYGQVREILSDGSIAPVCNLDVPPMAKADAIDAMLAKGGNSETSACVESLTKVDAVWGQSQCDEAPATSGGCAIDTSGATSALPGVALLAAVAWARRRRLLRKSV